MLFNYKNNFGLKILFISLVLIISLNFTFASNNNTNITTNTNSTNNTILNLKQITLADNTNDNLFFINKNGELSVSFNITSNYNKQNLNLLNNPKIVVSYLDYDNNNRIKYILSNKEIDFTNSINKNIVLNIITNNFLDSQTRLKIQVDLFDEFDNLLETKRIYLRFKSNNSDSYYPTTNDHSKPRFLGYNYSRNFAILQSNKDKDMINIEIKTNDNYKEHHFSLSCSSDTNISLLTKINPKNSKIIDLEIGVDNNKTLEEGTYIINCYLQDSSEKIKLGDISLKYIDVLEIIEEEGGYILEEDTNNKVDFSKITGFFSLNKPGFNLRFFLLGFVIVGLLLMLIKTNK